MDQKNLVRAERIETKVGVLYKFFCNKEHQHGSRQLAAACSRSPFSGDIEMARLSDFDEVGEGK